MARRILPAGPRRPAVAIGVRLHLAGGDVSSSAGDVAISRSTAAQTLGQYRASQQPRRPSVEFAGATQYRRGKRLLCVPPSTELHNAGLGLRRLEWLRHGGVLGRAWRAVGVRPCGLFPAISGRSRVQQWRQQVMRDPTTAARLAALGDGASAAPPDAGATAAAASSGSSIVWIVLFVAVAVFALLWLARRRAAHRPAASSVPGISGSTATRSVSAKPSRLIRRHSCSPPASPRCSRHRAAG